MRMLFAALGGLIVPAFPAIAASYADLDAIDREVTAFVHAETGQAAGVAQVDRRLRLAPCAQRLALGWHGRTRDSVLVQCTMPDGWRLFVPVMRQGRERPASDFGQGGGVIARGDAVTIIVRGEHYRLTDRGTALGAGAAGDWIEVKPSRKEGKPLQARVISPGVVDIQLP